MLETETSSSEFSSLDLTPLYAHFERIEELLTGNLCLLSLALGIFVVVIMVISLRLAFGGGH